MYTGLAASESVNVPPDSRAIVKSGAEGPSGGGFGASVEEVEDWFPPSLGGSVDDTPGSVSDGDDGTSDDPGVSLTLVPEPGAEQATTTRASAMANTSGLTAYLMAATLPPPTRYQDDSTDC
jgi:hypothetical protein